MTRCPREAELGPLVEADSGFIMEIPDNRRSRIVVEKIRAVPPIPLAAGIVVTAMLGVVLVRAEHAVRHHIAVSEIRPEVGSLMTIIEWTAGAIVAIIIFSVVMRPIVEALRRVFIRARRWRALAAIVIFLSVAVVTALVFHWVSANPRLAQLMAGTEWWTAEIFILAVMTLILWLTIKDTVEGFVRYRILSALIVILALIALLFAFVFILSIYYLPGWAVAVAGALLALIVMWFAAAQIPLSLVILAFVATLATIPWIPDWHGTLGFIVWLLVLGLTAARADQPSKLRWFTWVEALAWIVLLALTAQQWALL